MRKVAVLILCLLVFSSFADARTPQVKRVRYVPSDLDTRWADHNGPWDFSGMLGLYVPGFGIEALAAYRVVNDILPNIDDSLSVESGLGMVFVSDTVAGYGVSYTAFEIPLMARWDFRVTDDSKLVFGPRAGFNILTGGTVSTPAGSYSTRGGTVYLQLGGFGMYRFSEQLGARVGIQVGGYTTLTLGATYFL